MAQVLSEEVPADSVGVVRRQAVHVAPPVWVALVGAGVAVGDGGK